jgi:group I intron endonuclease
MNPYGFIYITTNTINGKQYIGQSNYIKRNWRTYLGSGKALKAALKKYGKENFSREIIMDCSTKEDLNAMERHFIHINDAIKSPEYYNISPGGKASLGFTGKTLSPEHLNAIKTKCQNRVITDHMRQQSAINCKRTHSSAEKKSRNRKLSSKDNPKSISITIDGVEYETLSTAAKSTPYSYHQIRKMAGLYKPKPNTN